MAWTPRKALPGIQLRAWPWRVPAAGIVFALVVALVDRASGGDVSFLALYALPVLLTTLASGPPKGVAVAIVATCAWFLARCPSPEPPAVLAWNTLNRAVIFGMVALLATLYRRESSSARRDPLTGLPNRRAIFETLYEAASTLDGRAGSDAVMMLDLDRFKEINDSGGHAAGDEALRTVAHVLRRGTRPGDFAGRLAGDEFVLLLRRVSLPQA